ncbi:MAG: AbrB/MazE/SpoVT family DNA-binding domain-containing protein [Aeromicrobium sp.]|jgi:putative addiction module antidote|nr:AbrB/MazE/SpoVT family DNA-binding domain-containing protein [Burkholderiales bacterium]
MSALKLTQIGNSVGVILPKEVLARLKLAKGDTVYLTENPDGVTLTPNDPGFEQQMEAARTIMKKRRAVLRELAK